MTASITAFLTLTMLLAGADQSSTPQAPAEGQVSTFHVSGRYDPELVPAQMLWESFFRHMATVDTDDEVELPRAKRVAGLSKYTLRVPVTDVEIVVRVAAETVEAIDMLRERMRASKGLSIAERKTILARSGDEALKGRDELARALSRTSFDAVRRYVTEEAIKSIQVDLPINPR